MTEDRSADAFMHGTWNATVPHLVAMQMLMNGYRGQQSVPDKKNKMDRKKTDRIFWRG